MAEPVVVRAYIKGAAQAPRKVNLVASLVRGRKVADAIVILEHTPKRSALIVKKAIESARANAITNHSLDASSLVIETLSITVGARIKRFKPVSRGRAHPFEKISSNILVGVSGIEKVQKKAPAKKSATAKKVNQEAE